MQINQNRILARCLPNPLLQLVCPTRATYAKSSHTGCGCCACRENGLRNAWPTSATWIALMSRPLSAASGTSHSRTSSAWLTSWMCQPGRCSSRPRHPLPPSDRHSLHRHVYWAEIAPRRMTISPSNDCAAQSFIKNFLPQLRHYVMHTHQINVARRSWLTKRAVKRKRACKPHRGE